MPTDTTIPDPLTVTLAISLDMPLGDRYRQTGEESWSSTPVTVLDAVIERVAGILAKSAADADASYKRDLRARMFNRIDSIVDRLVEPVVTEVLNGEVRRTNTLGEFVGAPTTLRELVIEAAKKQLVAGKNNSSFSQSRTSLDEAIAATAKSVVAKELADVIAEAKQVVKDALASSVAETMADTITRAMAR